LYKSQQPADALPLYLKAQAILRRLSALKLTDSLLQKASTQLISVLLNKAACFVQLGADYAPRTVKACSKVLEIDENNVKAYYRRAQAWGQMNNSEAAVEDLEDADRLEKGKNPEVAKALRFHRQRTG